MRMYLLGNRTELVVGLSLLLVACGNPAAEHTTLPPAAAAAPAAATAPVAPVIPVTADAAPAATDAVAVEQPALSAMSLATGPTKLGVPVDLRYQFAGAVQEGASVTLHLAAVPRVAGTNLKVTIKDEPGIQAKAAPIAAQKVTASTAYREQLTITRKAGGPTELRVLVTMDLPEGSAFGWFSVPFGATPAVSKQAPVRQE